MSSKVTYLLYALLAAGVALWLFSRWDGDRRRIERQLTTLQELIENDDGESALSGASKARQIGDLLTRDFELLLEPFSSAISDRGRLAQATLAYRNRAQRVRLEFSDRELEIDDRLRVADMTVVAAVSGAADGRSFRESYRIAIRWAIEEGEWRMRSVELLEVLEGLPELFG